MHKPTLVSRDLLEDFIEPWLNWMIHVYTLKRERWKTFSNFFKQLIYDAVFVIPVSFSCFQTFTCSTNVKGSLLDVYMNSRHIKLVVKYLTQPVNLIIVQLHLNALFSQILFSVFRTLNAYLFPTLWRPITILFNFHCHISTRAV